VYRQPRSGFTRIPYVQSCALEVDGRERDGVLCNLSLLGAYVHVDPPLEPGTRVAMRFLLPDGPLPVASQATVTWINHGTQGNAAALPAGCGLRFTGLGPDEVRRISALVASFQSEPRPQLARPEPQPEKVRIPFVAQCVVSSPRGLARGSVCNLSANGVYITLDPLPALGEAVIVAFRLPGGDDLFERAAVVAWLNPDGPGRVRALPPGCGLRFVNLSEPDRERLAKLIQEFLGQLPQGAA
jgi:uncharacterized protein (TIGR02266 family)